MSKTNKNKGRPEKRFSDLVGIDFSTTATKVVRLRKSKGVCSLVGMDHLPPIDFNTLAAGLELPRNLMTHYACLAYSGPRSVLRMINAPLKEDDEALPEEKLRELLNVTDDFRASVKLIQRGKGRKDSSFLAAAIPKDDVQFIRNLFPAGPPAPASVEVAGLSFVSAFLHARGEACAHDSVCLLDTGETVSNFVFLNNNTIALVGRLSFGVKTFRSRIADDLGVDDELAASILSDRAIDISSSVRSVLEPFLKQLSISMDFLARHQGCRVSKIFVSGGMSLVPSWIEEVGNMLTAEVSAWSPLENIEYDPESIPSEMIEQASRFTAAIGAAIGGLE